MIGIDYAQGLAAMKAALPAQHQAVLMTLADRLADNLRTERLYGSTETRRAERAAIIYELNDLALQVLGVSFNELCMGCPVVQPGKSAPSTAALALPKLSPATASKDTLPLATASRPDPLSPTRAGAPSSEESYPLAVTPLRVFPTLEICILPRQEAGYPVDLIWDDPNSPEVQVFGRGYLSADLIPWVSTGDWEADGRRLFTALVTDPHVLRAWANVEGDAAQRRICLNIDEAACELQLLPWELLYDRGFLAANNNTPFSRLMPASGEWPDVLPQPPVRVLVAVANPRNLQDYNLAPLPDTQVTALTQVSLTHIHFEVLPAPVTLACIGEALHEGEYQALHIMAHGKFSQRSGEGALLLQDIAGNACVISDADMVNMFNHLDVQQRPRLVFLAACESAAHTSTVAFAGVGSRLGRGGVPMVIAMQDQVSMYTAQRLSEVFYKRLAAHGVVDLALNEARAMLYVERAADQHVPLLYMRPGSGRLWHN